MFGNFTQNPGMASGYGIFSLQQNFSFPSLHSPVAPCLFNSSMHSRLIFHPSHVMNPEAVISFCMVRFQIHSYESVSVICKKITANHLEKDFWTALKSHTISIIWAHQQFHKEILTLK